MQQRALHLRVGIGGGGQRLSRRCHRGEITDEDRRNYLDVFVYDCAESYHLIPAERPTIERGLDLTQWYFLRGYDSVQLAGALTASAVLAVADLAALIFVSADEGLLAAAVAEGLKVEEP